MQLPKDLISGTYRAPKVILCQTNKDKICQLDVTELQGTFKFNGYSEISFKVASIYTDLITGEQKRTPYYDYIEGIRLVYLEGFGYFQLQDPEIYGDGIQEYKSVNAYSLEYSLSQRYLENFIINMGDAGDTIGSIDGVVLYNQSDKDHSLLHLVLQKAYGWAIGHVDNELVSQCRSFEIDRESIYDFIMNDMCETFQCYVEFDTINNLVNVYSENEIERFVGDGETKVFKLSHELSDSRIITINGHETEQYEYNENLKELALTIPPAHGDIIEVTDEFKSKYDTDVLVSFENLSNEMHINYSADDIKTVLTIKGADDLNIRNVNFGLPSIMNLDYYCTPEWMGDKLYHEYLAYIDKQDKYMSGFYSEDVSGAAEELFKVVSTKQDFIAGSTREFIAQGTQESFSANGDISYFNIDKTSVTFDIDMTVDEAHFDLSRHKDKVIVSISVNNENIEANRYEFNSGVLKIYGLNKGDSIIVKLVKNEFFVSNAKDKISSVKIDSTDINKKDYSFNSSTNILTIQSSAESSAEPSVLEKLYDGNTIVIESVNKWFILNQTKGMIISVKIDGAQIKKDGVDEKFSYSDGKLSITSNKLQAQSDIVVESIDNQFYASLLSSEKIDSVKIGETVIENVNYEYDNVNAILTIKDTNLKAGDTVRLLIINKQFNLREIQGSTVANVIIGENETNNYEILNDNILEINDTLQYGDQISVISINNRFAISNDVGSKYIVMVNKHQISNGTHDGYEYNSETKILTIHAKLKDGDEVRVKIDIDSANALLVVEADAKDGEILKKDVTPTLKSYTPKVGDYVVKKNGYIEILQQLYKLIDNRLNEENSVSDEYKIIELILKESEFNNPTLVLPTANIENLGVVYKIIKTDENETTYTYYVCEMKIVVSIDDGGQEHREYEYAWNERDLVFGGDGINSLKEKIDIYSSINSVQIAAEWDKNPQGSDEYISYSENLKKLQDTKKELEKKQKAVDGIEEEIKSVRDKIKMIAEDVNINSNFSPDSLDRLSLFLREDEYTDDCFLITDIDTDLDIINTQKELLVSGYKKLKTISCPTLSFSASMKNIYAIPEFEPILHQFKLGNFIKIRIRPDFIKKARLLEVQLNFEDLSSFSCTFGDLLSVKSQGDLHADLLAQAVNAGKSVASGSSYWQKGYDVATAIDERIRQGLIDATTSIRSNSAGQDISWDNYGIHLRKIVDGVLDNHEGWITNNKFLYSDDNFKTTKSVFGNYVIDNKTYWGILAGCVSAGLIEGSKIIGGEICIGERDDGTYNFRVAPDGTVTMNKGDVATKLSYFSFDGNNGLIIGENKNGDYFSRVSTQKIEFCRKAKIITVYSEPTFAYQYYDYILYQHTDTEKNITYYDYYKNPDFINKADPKYEVRYTSKDPIDIEAEIKFGIPITYFANDTAYMKQAESEGSLKVGTKEQTPSISLGKFRIQIENNGSLSVVSTL